MKKKKAHCMPELYIIQVLRLLLVVHWMPSTFMTECYIEQNRFEMKWEKNINILLCNAKKKIQVEYTQSRVEAQLTLCKIHSHEFTDKK